MRRMLLGLWRLLTRDPRELAAFHRKILSKNEHCMTQVRFLALYDDGTEEPFEVPQYIFALGTRKTVARVSWVRIPPSPFHGQGKPRVCGRFWI